ncbi:class II fructose-bisphosphate aldolase [Solirubrobacter soli]|uniref:class II fructose-bisphosphate aldolase n=1 Tax=Solirubrobacter soli TaxID=363832 RepID=UPI00041226DD|nr:class II fructose-bisphosphate aldolase [Solirubrobacter soli]
MLATGTSVLQRGRAVAAITTYTLESTVAIVAAAERLRRPVLLSAGVSSYAAVGRELLAAAALAAARAASVPVGVHLDHCRDRAEIDACLALGYSSVMIDGSHLPFEENVAVTREVVARAHAAGAWVEAELGALAGDEDRSGEAASEGMTDPAEAAEFVERTGVDALAVAVGNVHGFTPEPVRLDLDRLRAIAAVCSAPLVLHGASGLPDEDLLGAVAAGVVKVNVNAELRRAHIEALKADVGDDVRALQRLAIEAMTGVAEEKIALLAP